MIRNRRRDASSPSRRQRELLELTCVVDGHSHLVAIDAFATASATGAFPALCGHEVHAGSMSNPPGPECRRCGTAYGHAS